MPVFVQQRTLCAVAMGLAANGRFAEAYAEARDIVDTIRDYAATMPIQLHRLGGKVTIIEGSGGDIAVLPCGRQVVRRCRRHRDAPAHLGRCQ
jgi:hypothetical protein